jgi:hypothetical protein
MIKLGKPGLAAVISLLLSLVLFATGAFAQSADQKIDRGRIHVSARTAVLSARGLQHPSGWGEGSGDGGDGWGGGCGWGGNCGDDGFAMHQAFHESVRCTAMHECRSVRECETGPWGGHGCRSVRICRRISVCHRCHTRDGWAGNGWANSWAARH